MISQDEIVSNAKTVTKGLEALRQEHESILGGIKGSLEHGDLGQENSLIQEKCSMIQRSLEMIELGLGEAHVMAALAGHLQTMEAEKQKLRSQVKRLCQENAWLRDELASTQQKLQVSQTPVFTVKHFISNTSKLKLTIISLMCYFAGK